MHHQLAHSLEDALKYFVSTIPYEEIFEIKYEGLRVINNEPKEKNSAWSYHHSYIIPTFIY